MTNSTFLPVFFSIREMMSSYSAVGSMFCSTGTAAKRSVSPVLPQAVEQPAAASAPSMARAVRVRFTGSLRACRGTLVRAATLVADCDEQVRRV
ncbi:hypothetical protein E1292_38815 [Nonomuraea deserti]|uniref:Uncharacterized protein n=1 Tax=Nonomuraea deserti TaxID=1848322 RepID=A0A4R4V969_9ACTN|nr:hypothetical protein [Nonomuraea deserti]TDC95989.1 hypothetical protein E1292_38815 [Nonomuraea deserti]